MPALSDRDAAAGFGRQSGPTATDWHRIEQGSGRPLVLLHGAGLSSLSWVPVIDLLAAARRVIAFDLPGFGRTPLPPAFELSPAYMIGLLRRQLEILGITEPVDIVGNSLGGFIAFEAAKAGLARSVVALGPAGLWRRFPRSHRAWLLALYLGARGLDIPVARRIPLPSIPARATLPLMTSRTDRLSEALMREIVHDAASSPLMLRLLVGTRDRRFEGGQGITVPITVVFGVNDQIVREGDCRMPDELPPHTQWLVLDRCGHMPMWDEPEQVAGIILEHTAEQNKPGLAAAGSHRR